MTKADTFKQIILIACTMVVSLIVVEGLLRLKNRAPAVLAFKPTADKSMLVKVPNVDRLMRSEAGTVVHVKTNSQGFSGPEFMVSTSSPATRPIVFLGDSFTQAVQVDYDKKFTSLLANQITSTPILNFAQDGGTILEDVAVYKNYVRELNPGLVVLVVSQHIYEMVDLTHRDYLLQTDIDNLSVSQLLGAKVAAYEASRVPWKDFLRQFQIVRHLLQLKRTNVHVIPPKKIPAIIEEKIAMNPYDINAAPSLTTEQEEQVQLVIDVIKKINEWIKKDGGVFALVVIPDPSELQGGSAGGNKMVVEAFCGSIPLLDLMPVFSSVLKNDRTQLYINDVGHLTESGHELVAKEVRQFVDGLKINSGTESAWPIVCSS